MRGIALIILIISGLSFTGTVKNRVTALDLNNRLKINDSVTHIIVSKSERKLYAYYGDTVKWYYCAFGANPYGHKQKKGDNKTPEGKYYISLKNPNSRGYKSLKISYPNAADKARAKKKGVSPGGDIMIHGLWWPSQDPETHWMYNWTWGCIAINNTQIDELFKWTFNKIPITIKP